MDKQDVNGLRPLKALEQARGKRVKALKSPWNKQNVMELRPLKPLEQARCNGVKILKTLGTSKM